MRDTPSEEAMAAWRAFLLTYSKVMRTLEQEMQESEGLTLSWYDILAHLDCAPEGAIRMQFLADSILLSRSGLTRLIDRMADAGLVTRKACPEDRRGTYVVITPDGRAAFRRAMPGHIRGIQEHFLRHMSEEDVRALRGALSKVLEAEPGNQKEILDSLSVTARGG
ncbi:MAG: MarR family transcriptional regulator [Chloroflexi bacterium]|nr:MarR family transcriptional regulator [Chloroflexota bacterium]